MKTWNIIFKEKTIDGSGFSDVLAEIALALQGDKDMSIDLYDRFAGGRR